MDEYIERSAVAAKAIYLHGFGKNKYVPLRVIEDAPSADVAPVKRGRWEHDSVGFDDFWRCSACREDWFFEYDPEAENTRVNYCPNCGARMDGE